MPFTFAHPAIILPLYNRYKQRLSLTGLITGSILPDLVYLFDQSKWSHSISGLLLFDLPIGICFMWFFHSLIKRDLILNSPEFVQRRLIFQLQFNWPTYFKNRYVVICTSLVLGLFSHLLIDQITHGDGYFLTILPFLAATPDAGTVFQVPVFQVLQNGLSIIGVLYLVRQFLKMPLRANDFPVVNKTTYRIIYMSVFFSLSALLSPFVIDKVAYFGAFAKTIVSLLFPTFLVTSVIYRLTSLSSIVSDEKRYNEHIQ